MSAPENAGSAGPSPEQLRAESLRLQRQASQGLQDRIAAQMEAAMQAMQAAVGAAAQVSLMEATRAVAGTDTMPAEALGYSTTASSAIGQAVAAQQKAVEAAHAEASRAVAAAVAGMAPAGQPTEPDEAEPQSDPATPTQDAG